MMQKTVLVAGASGVVGQAATEHFASAADWTTIAVSRRAPLLDAKPGWRHVAIDLLDASACVEAVAALPPVTHLVFAALHEKPELVAGWRDPGQMQCNLAMLENLVRPLVSRGALAHVSLLQGTKAYGVHLHRIAVPAREKWPRDDHANFYWLQEDYLRARAAEHGFAFTIFRPQIIFGDAIGAAMNIMPVLGAYAAIRRAEGLPFSYPGGADYTLEAVDARLLARALAWAALAPAARNETFNLTNGDVFVWRNVWPAIAAALGMEAGEPEPLRLAEYLPARAGIWREIAARRGLVEPDIEKLLGRSHQYADYCMASLTGRAAPPALVSTIKLRKAGFGDCIDTEDMFRELFADLVAKKILPPP
ncbi:MAG: NAD-dependent epimerase/dehydratase family protein [Hyphomicrobiales bacterium]|nr:NAD-dependent epimerase/dehydratase family protein [Hyphomicrobiales bacterium]